MPKIEIKIAKTEEEIQKAFEIRKKTFCGEQGVAEDIEYDEYDKNGKAEHILLFEDGIAVGCARIRSVDGNMKLERLAVLMEYRGKGYGKALTRWMVDYCKRKNPQSIYMNAQYYLKGFYEYFGFEAVGEPFEEAGIKHIKMVYKR